MPYNNNVPLATDQIAATQAPILQNFQAIKTLIDVNHVTFDAAGQGKHNLVEMPNQASDPAGASAEMTLYSKSYSKTSVSEAYVLRNNLAGPNTPIPFTASLNSANGWAFLPCGLLIKWGSANYNVGANTTQALSITFPDDLGVTIPPFTNTLNVQVQVQNSGTLPGISLNAYVKSISNTTLAVEVGNSNASSQSGIIYYFVIGLGTP